MRLWLLITIMICAVADVAAQNMRVLSMTPTMEVITAQRQRKDLNGNKCALVRVQIPVEDVMFEGSVMGDVEFSYCEHLVYMPPGTKMLKIKCKGYKPLMVTFAEHGIESLGQNTVYVLDIELPGLSGNNPPADNFVFMHINPATANINVKIDGEPCIVTEGAVAKRLPAGQHNFIIDAVGYESANGTFVIKGEERTELTVNLVSLLATLDIIAMTPGCEIWVNGVKKGEKSWSGSLPAGSYLVEGRKDGCKPYETTVELEEKKNKKVAIPQLEVRYGSIDFQSTPMGATLSLNGKVIGTSPAIFRDIAPGTYTATVTADGYTASTATVTVPPEGETAVNISLTKAQNDSKNTGTGVQLSELTFMVKGVSFKMIHVPGGTFDMGDNKLNDISKMSPSKAVLLHKVTLSDYYIGETEVTQELWKAVMGNNPSNFTGQSNLPVEKVSWDDCQEFIKKLNELTGKNFSLPTEAEWEYAARGGNRSKGYSFSGNSKVGDVAWISDNSSNKTHPVKGKKANELGLYDMSGNVWEWCNDWYDDYSSKSVTNPTGPEKGKERVVRGGSYYYNIKCACVWTRLHSHPYDKYPYIGLRLCMRSQDSNKAEDDVAGRANTTTQNTTTPEKIRIRGKVTDTHGEELIGAGVKIEGSNNMVVANIDGIYEISAYPDQTLVFTYVGFKTVKIKIDNRTTINVVMKEK